MEEITKDIYVVGVKHRMKRELRELLAKQIMMRPLPLKLTREQENKYDLNAIRVNVIGITPVDGVPDDHFLGYIGAQSAEVLAPGLDDGSLVVLNASLFAIENAEADTAKGVMRVTFGKVEQD